MNTSGSKRSTTYIPFHANYYNVEDYQLILIFMWFLCTILQYVMISKQLYHSGWFVNICMMYFDVVQHITSSIFIFISRLLLLTLLVRFSVGSTVCYFQMRYGINLLTPLTFNFRTSAICTTKVIKHGQIVHIVWDKLNMKTELNWTSKVSQNMQEAP